MTIQKEDRLNVIKELIINNTIGSQDELLSLLIERGFDLTQATLSRDLKFLKVGRIPSDNGFKYVLSNEFVSSANVANQSAILMGFLSIEFSGNIAVIKTLPAYSHTIADFIDKAEISEIIGTIAGNDTVIAVVRDKITHNQVVNAITRVMPELKSKMKL